MNFKTCAITIVGAAGAGYFLAGYIKTDNGGTPSEAATTSAVDEVKVFPISERDYSFGYWQNGHRKHKGDQSADILEIETGYFGLSLDMAQLDKAKFGLLNDGLNYTEALEADGKRMEGLKDAELIIELEKDGKVFRATSTGAANERIAGDKFQATRLWESARYVQHYDIQELEFKAADGETLIADSKLNVIAWPDSLTLTAEAAPAVTYKTGSEIGVQGKAQCVVETPLIIPHQPGLENEKFTVESWVKVPSSFFSKSRGWILCKNRHEAHDGNFGFSIYAGQVRATMNTGGGSTKTMHTLMTNYQAMTPDKWHHLAMTYDGNTFCLYVDGGLKSSKVLGKTRILGKEQMVIGQRGDTHSSVTPVIMDQLRVWNRALNKNELTQHTRKPAEIANREGLTYENNFEEGPPIQRQVWENAKISVRLKDVQYNWYAEQKVAGKWKVDETKKVTVQCNLVQAAPDPDTKVTAAMKLNELPPVTYNKEFNCYVAEINRPKRERPANYSEMRSYDDIDITVDSKKEGSIPFLLEMFQPASITGLVPVLCDENGVPTGISVQLSKNWHYKDMGAYLRAYVKLPTIIGKKKYKLRIVYGFYGEVPSASHSQLSLVGWGGNGRWDQLAIGAWGETYCMDVDMSCVDVAVTDIRMLMARNGKKGKQWDWTDAGWGGDWLGLNDAKGNKHLFNGIKTSYVSHGPCLSDVKYDGFYGANREVDFKTTVRTLRTDDYARTFTTMKLTFDKKVNADGWLFKMGRSRHLATPKVAYGNAGGLIKEHVVPDGIKRNTEFIKPTELTGEGPWWVSYPGAYIKDGKDWGTGYRALIIRSYKATIGGKEYNNPTISFPAFLPSGDNSNLDFLMRPPVGVTDFNPGDTVEFDVEWITLPKVAADYYGPNEAFRKHVAENPSSWKTTYREAVGNNLKVAVDGGKLVSNYPIIIQTEKEEITVDIEGGVGLVPIRFDGLKQAEGYALYQIVDGKEIKLDQSVHGNDFWQTDYDVKENRFKITFNLPLDGLKKSKWILK